jgi:hypothetical protein
MDSTSAERARDEINVGDGEALEGLLESVESLLGAPPGEPVNLGTFLSLLHVEELVEVLQTYYVKPWKCPFPLDALCRLLIWLGVKRHRFLTQAHRELVDRPNLAASLGFADAPLPEYKTLWELVHRRLGAPGLDAIARAALRAVLREARANKIQIGGAALHDSTFLKGSEKDDEAAYSDYHKATGYKWHNTRCADTGLPIAWSVTPANEHDQPHLAPNLERAHEDGVRFAHVIADAAYDARENFALVAVAYGAQFLTDIRANAVEDRMWTAKRLRAFYHKHWRQPWFERRATFPRMLQLLVEEKGAFVQVGGYLRTIAMRRAARDPRVAKAYHVRSRIEGNHGLEKRFGEVRWTESRGLSKRKIQILLVVLGEVSLALTKLQYGITHELSRFVHFV